MANKCLSLVDQGRRNKREQQKRKETRMRNAKVKPMRLLGDFITIKSVSNSNNTNSKMPNDESGAIQRSLGPFLLSTSPCCNSIFTTEGLIASTCFWQTLVSSKIGLVVLRELIVSNVLAEPFSTKFLAAVSRLLGQIEILFKIDAKLLRHFQEAQPRAHGLGKSFI